MKGSELVIDRFDDAKKSEECKKARQLEFDHHVIVEPLEEAFLKIKEMVKDAVNLADVVEMHSVRMGNEPRREYTRTGRTPLPN